MQLFPYWLETYIIENGYMPSEKRRNAFLTMSIKKFERINLLIPSIEILGIVQVRPFCWCNSSSRIWWAGCLAIITFSKKEGLVFGEEGWWCYIWGSKINVFRVLRFGFTFLTTSLLHVDLRRTSDLPPTYNGFTFEQCM